MIFEGLTITIGCPGAGKSTWADNNLPPETLRLERDRFREALFGSRRAYHESLMKRQTRSDIITATMREAMRQWPFPSCAVTDTGLAYGAVEPFIDLVGDHNIRLVIFPRDPEFLLTNNRIRPHEHRIPEEILLEKIVEFSDPEAWWKQELPKNFVEIVYV